MEKDKFLEIIFNSGIGIILENINSDDHNYMKDVYKKYVENAYGELDIPRNKYNEMIETFSAYEINTWKNMTEENKKKLLIEDENLYKIKQIKMKSLSLVENRINDNQLIELSTAREYINLIEIYLKDVKDFNLREAEEIAAEAKLNFKYAAGLSEATSVDIKNIKFNI